MTGAWGARSPRVAAQRGISIVVVVIVVVITIILCTAALILWATMMEKERIQISLSEAEWNKARAKDKSWEAIVPREVQIRQDQEKIKEERLKSGEPTGYPSQGEEHELNPAETLKFMTDKRKLLFVEGTDADKRKREDSSLMATAQELVPLAAARVVAQKNRVAQLQLDKDVAASRLTKRQEIGPSLKKLKEEYASELGKRTADLQKATTDETNAFQAKLNEFNAVKKKAEDELAADATIFEDRKIKYENEIRELTRQLDELKVKEVIKHEVTLSHGHVLTPDAPNKVAFIDIGSRERVVPGLKFMAAKRGELGRFIYKAELEVKKVWMTYSEVRILKVFNKDMPVVDGDLLVNPLFSKERPIIVAFAGNDKPIKLRYSVDEATRRIREIGSEVRPGVTLDVDYVIWTEQKGQVAKDADPVYQKAVLLEIPIDEASEVFRFLGD